MVRIDKYKTMLEQSRGKADLISKEIKELKKDIKCLKKNKKNSEQAQIILQNVAKATQQKLEIHISDLVTMAISAVFDDSYNFKLEFIEKRNKIEASLKFEKEGYEINPMLSCGGGVVDVASFALRIALWTLRKPKSANVIIMDEPFRFLSRDLQPKAGEMMKLLSNKLNLQFIIVTHNEDLIEVADSVITIKNKKGVSYVI